ncbi:ABC transporter ATP-binding protein [Marinimicrococcus flavescens]|uniref:ABC transporter ATP-binding protein n=1 Tax=Marinimicrococcus flavescens TaxID=3031815 RepID=A0AAP3UY95_9PROT|nr:ABC transporter ATP-binding protein [Marinimicrococcus flavescens]
MAEVVLRDLVRRYGEVVAVDRVSLTVADREFVTLLGPSGCGKSTTLAAIAGLERPTSGFLAVGGETFFDSRKQVFVEAEHRNLGLVFQSYALWPHKTVQENVAFPLQLRRIARNKQKELIHEALALVEMESFADRYPSQLSGGQQQRVALARTLVYKPKVLLLDEPLSNLDAKLRDRARTWLRHLQREVGITTIYVTHDQTEALSLSDRIAVMSKGRIAQLGTPHEIYERPADPFVADFIGTSNFFTGEVMEQASGRLVLRLADEQTITVEGGDGMARGSRATLAVRPERIHVGGGTAGSLLKGRITERAYMGARWLYTVEVGGQAVRVETEADLASGEVALGLPERDVAVFPAPAAG